MKRIKLVSVIVLVIISLGKSVSAQMVVDNTITVNDLVNEYLVGENVQVFNILINGVPGDQAYLNAGLFNSTNSNIPIEDGIVMGPMDVNYIIEGDGAFGSGDLPDFYDIDLDSIVAPLSINPSEYAVLEFDFIPLGEKVVFRYVFSSEEYPNYVCSQYNDAFGFFISGPGIDGPYSDNAENIAIIPGTDLPVAINTVNDGNPASPGNEAGCPEGGLDNAEFFIVNYNMPLPATAMNGFTVVLEASSIVECGEMYHLKMAIANVSDGALDSGVFLESGSFGAIPLVEIGIDSPTDSSLVGEGCEFDFVFTRLLDAEADTIPLTVSGLAEEGVDYQVLPDFVIFEPGQSVYNLTIFAFYNEEIQGVRDLQLSMEFFTCGDTIVFDATAFITDSDPLGIVMGGPEVICNDFLEFSTMNANVTGGYGDLQYYWTRGSLGGYPLDPTDSLNQHPTDQPPFFSNNWLTVVDECGLFEESSEPYYTENKCPIFAPNIFTPQNGDDKNDVLYFENMELFPNTGLAIYDRWGKEVYKTNDYLNDWSPTEEEAADGTYFWVLTLTVAEVEGNRLSGYIVIRRDRPRN